MKSGQYSSARPLLRSLLQKAVRRGCVDLATKASITLAAHGDSTWLKTRVGVIAFEECWPLAAQLHNESESAKVLDQVARAIKNKNAAGLGSLAYAASIGDSSAINIAPDPIAVKIVAASLKRPQDFFKWIASRCNSEADSIFVNIARRFHTQASWPWDKAFASAAAFFCTKNELPLTSKGPVTEAKDFPIWISIDKHTPQGKLAIRQVASRLGIPLSQLEWASFYCESAKVNAIEDGEWWKTETNWRLSSLGLDFGSAEQIWQEATPYMKDLVDPFVKTIQESLNSSDKLSLI